MNHPSGLKNEMFLFSCICKTTRNKSVYSYTPFCLLLSSTKEAKIKTEHESLLTLKALITA